MITCFPDAGPFRRIGLILLFCAGGALRAAQDGTGAVAGKVVSAETGQGVAGATVTVAGTLLLATTDLNGSYALRNVAAGMRTLAVSKDGYRPAEVTEVAVTAGGNVRVDLPLQASADPVLKLEAFSVSAEVVAGSDIGLLGARQKAIAVSDAIGSDQFSRLAVGNAAEALGKVTGASVVDGKYVLIRGLGDRYSNTLLNGAAVPSADPDKRAVQMDQFPSDLLDSITTTKSFTPEQPGAFSGGSVNVKTKSFAERFFVTVSLGATHNSNASGEEILVAPGNLGSVPAVSVLLPSRTQAELAARQGNFIPAEELDRATKLFSAGMYPGREKAPLNTSGSLAFGNRHAWGEDGLFGYIVSATFDRSFAHSTGGEANRFLGTPDAPQARLLLSRDRSQLSFDPATARSAPAFGVTASTESESRGGFAKLALRTSPQHEASLDLFFTRGTDSEVRRGVGEEAINYVGSVFEVYDVLRTERMVGSAQLAGKSVFPAAGDLQLEWRVSQSRSTQDQPDYRTLAAIYTPGGTFVNATGVQPNRFFRELEEDATESAVDLTYPFAPGGREHRVKVGALASENDRDYREQRFQYGLSPRSRNDFETFPAPVGILGRTANNVTFGNTVSRLQEPNNYTGEQKIRAGYAMFDGQLARDLRVIAGVRFEATELRTAPRATVGSTPKPGEIDQTDTLPALSFVWAATPKTNWRVAYGRTMARPTYKELTDIRYEDVFTGDVYLGNPDLELTVIDNFDLRWEWFPRRGETIAVSAFYKRMRDPIEVLYEPTVGSIQPQNVARGTVQGVEFEFRRDLRFLHRAMADFSVGTNLTFVASEITIPARELAILRAFDAKASDKRELLGQSPYVFNFDVTWDRRASSTLATISFNVVGERLDLVNFGPLPDVYEQPAPLLNFVLSQRLSARWKLKFSARNLLDPDHEKTIGLQNSDLIHARHTKGRSFGLSVSYAFD
ncbi:MAG: hypothetical protein B9S34_04110 [Opitutia bacterium Tous-C1TDCM]|nr:MAG: hypothetical protein B9S34_04110 [Opitutae bacterium Tous-C1TDCM]